VSDTVRISACGGYGDSSEYQDRAVTGIQAVTVDGVRWSVSAGRDGFPKVGGSHWEGEGDPRKLAKSWDDTDLRFLFCIVDVERPKR
jgi:hypothetical protein